MANIPTISDFEIAKLMLDPKRNQILTIAASEPVTVKQMAEKMDELPSRLYYHVKKLEEAGFLELVETKQQGNLIEKYYMSNKKMNTTYHLDDKMASENSAYLMQRFMSLINSGLSLIQHGMETGSKEHNASANIAFESITEAEWKLSLEKINQALSTKSDQDDQAESELKDEALSNSDELESDIAKSDTTKPSTGQPEPDADKKHDYVYVMLTYRLEDAERLANELQNQLPQTKAKPE